jgi:hypothetical protein
MRNFGASGDEAGDAIGEEEPRPAASLRRCAQITPRASDHDDDTTISQHATTPA